MVNIKSDFIDSKVINLMSHYEKLRRKGGDKYFFIFPRKDPKKAKYWEAFKGLVTESFKKDSLIPDPKIWIDAQFEILKLRKIDDKFICPPNYLFGERAWKRYHKYIDTMFRDQSITEHCHKNSKINIIPIIAEIKETYRFLKKYFKNNSGSDEIYFDKFLLVNENSSFLINRKVSYYFLASSKSFAQYKNKKLIGNLDIYKKIIDVHKEIKNLLIDLFGDEIQC